MGIQAYYENDVDREVLRSRKIAILGYGSQGRAHACNLRDSGYTVVVAQRTGGSNHALAVEEGFAPISVSEATQGADLLILALPDESMAGVYESEIQPHLREGQALGFIHGFSIRYRTIVPPPGVDIIMIAPKGPGSLVRERYIRGGGLTCLMAVHQDATGMAQRLALAWGAGIGGGRGGMIETTFSEECESDLFGEQVVLCGGVIELMKSAYEVLVEAGFPEELAYFECIHEVKQVIDLQYAGGFAEMRRRVSNTAAYGGLTVGQRIVTDQTREEMRAVLKDIQSGEFAARWVAECRAGKPRLTGLSADEAGHSSEAAGRAVRLLAEGSPPNSD